MKIIALEAENVKRIKAVSIKPNGAIVEITGANGAGKSSILDAIFWALAEAKHIQDVPVRKGADRAVIKLDLGKLKVTRIIRAKDGGEFTQSLKVENEEGAAYKSPQGMLDALVGALSFDPLEFTRMDARKQFDACRQFVPDFDFDANAAARKTAFEKRTDVNRRAKEFRAQADGVKLDAKVAAAKRVDESGLVAELDQAGQHNADVERRRGNREQAGRDIAGHRAEAVRNVSEADRVADEIKRLRSRETELRENARRLNEQADDLQTKLDAAGALPEPIDTAALRQAIEAARETNKAIDAALADKARKAELEDKAKTAEHDAETLTKEIEACDKAKREAIEKAKLPVPGLTFADGAILLDDLPFNQASGAAQLRVSCAVAAALNPKLRVLRVKDGALLDRDSMKLLAEFAEANDMQIWVESVQSDRPSAIVIEDGMVKGADGATEAA